MTMNVTAVRCPAVVVLYFLFMGLYPVLCDNNKFRILDIYQHGKIGDIATLNCTASTNNATIQWFFKDKLLNESEINRIKIIEKNGMQSKNDDDGNALTTKTSTVTITNITSEDAGNYTCVAKHGTLEESMVTNLNLSFAAKVLNITKTQHVYITDTNNKNVTLECEFEVYHLTEIKWHKNGLENNLTPIPHVKLDERRYKSSVIIPIHNFDENGTYVCEVLDADTPSSDSDSVDIMVYSQPFITINDAFGISTKELFLNWSLTRYNSKIEDISIYISISNDTKQGFHQTHNRVDPKNTSIVLSELERNKKYAVKFQVETKGKHFTQGYSTTKQVETLDFDPMFVPNISINGFSATSVTIAWAPPPADIEKYIQYYLLEARKKGENVPRKAYHSRDSRNLPYMFDNLEPHSTYIFQVCACAYYVSQRCGNWSERMEAATLDGIPSKPTKVVVDCGPDNMNITWDEPVSPNAEIKGYTMELTGKALFEDRYGKLKETTWGPLSKFTKNNTRRDSFQDLQPNTNYTVRLSAMTRTRRRGDEHVGSCHTLAARPDQPPRPRWRKIFQDKKYLFKMYLPRITERNGPICCYRVFMVRLSPQTVWEDLSLPEYQDIPVYNHSYVHASPAASGAYITDVFSNANFPADSELVMGDGFSQINKSDAVLYSKACLRRCLEEVTTTTTSTSTTTTVKTTTVDEMFDQDDLSTDDPVTVGTTVPARRRRSDSDPYSNDPIMQNHEEEPFKLLVPLDGPLDPNAKYTLYVELIPGQSSEKSMFSNYVNVLEAAPTPAAPQPATTLEIALQVTCAAAALVLLLMIIFCVRHTRRSRKAPHHAPLEMNTLERAIRWMFPSGRGRGAAPAAPPDVPPIAREDLAAAYAERQLDSDYLFQKEFELLQMLPECYPDRTTHASEARENQPKNRYPDIKAYDQTRVKLTQIDSITGSDYINANYVTGYKERKQFICAQGPTDTTVNDFWRMIWEHRLELIVMLTNLEEYSKVKCSKYWPDELRGSRAFGAVTVHHVSEKRYSDYIVRELRITKQQTNSDGQPIVENNGVAKRNGDIKEAADGSVPTSPREAKDVESRTVRQYHFLMWKDFAAPEHAYSILKFIKRVNEAWSSTLSRPVVVHCSAGVGRTGTLVALDCLLHQLQAEGHAAVFNTVCELRRQRNFLVQSLKQYVFVYRALAEYTVYGDTELPASRLKAAVDRLRSTPPAAAASLMEIEFEKILNSPIAEPVKSCAAGAAEELRAKNRSQDILPYDRNRVILAPVPGRDFSTYINASFIEAYDNSEGFIITQDPLPNTIMDFWRMVSEHNVTTIVMLSELGEGKCPRYWEDGAAQHEHISVQYEDSESCPYYTRRQFRLLNNKSGVSQCVRQLQYQGWPTAAGHVPEVTRGLAELADAAAAADPATMLVHCQLGTERSSLFVCLCILISQIRVERRVDVCSLARKVRSQRAHTIDTFLHYEFLHRAILNYAELHNLLEDS